MRIKQVELNGFKSFRERTVLELPAGISAIVGPNGCGKSNVVDAIRWVLGEQSPKHLRGAAMEDVIFNGNADHGPVGMAEVSLLLERDEADFARACADAEGADLVPDGLPPELARAAEVLVTRRYFRSGESEYFINRVPCRLRDITELFLGTGVGTKAYAIIEQGRVEQLVNAKPEEMRLFIEEAAGTTRFRSRKVAAERKMQRTRDNLVRVQDVMRELERQMGSLERQARRAEEYHRIKGELRELDLTVMAARRRTLAAELEAAAARVDALRDEETRLVGEIDRIAASGGEARAARVALEDRCRGVEADLGERRTRAAQATTEAQSWTARRAEREARAAAARAEHDELGARIAALREEAVRQGGACEAEAVALAAAEAAREDADRRLADLVTRGGPLEAAVEDAKTALVDAAAEEARKRNLVEALLRRRSELEGQRQRLEEEQRLLGERLERNTRDREAARARGVQAATEQDGLVAEADGLAATERTLRDGEETAAARVLAAREAVTQLRSRADSLRELEVRHEGCTRGTSSLLERADAGARLMADVLRVPAHLERAVAAALGARLADVVVEDSAAAQAAVAWLVEAHAGSATVIPRAPERRAAVVVPPGRRLVDEIAVEGPDWSLAEALLGGVLLAENLEQALATWRAADHAVTVVTLAGEAIDPLGAIRGGSEAPFEEALLARRRELRELDATIAAREADAQLAEDALTLVRSELAATVDAGHAVQGRLQASRVARVAIEKDVERLEEERGRITAELELSALEANGLAGADGEVAGELAAMTEGCQRAEAAVAELRGALAVRQAELASWRTAHAQGEEERTAAAIAVVTARERHRAAVVGAERQEVLIRDADLRLAQLGREVEHAIGEACTAATEAEQAAASAREAGERALGLEVERDDLRRQVGELDVALEGEDRAERAVRAELERVRVDCAQTEVATAEARLATQHLVEQLAERYGLDPQALEGVPPGEMPHDEQAARAEQLRTRLLRLGDVNPAAAEELRELRERFEFLCAQRDDLEHSLEDLRQTIARLNRTSRERFDETFVAVNRTLEEVFPKLFPGGRARLELVPLEEGGEQGIEIVVQPAGKKLQSLSLLSGGEKALTATALVFSLFLIRPTPFCLLDEVDAPLDEANIGRFNGIVREMAERSQFVLITHNRRTMEVADTLYGITMEQAGVSKVVSVRLREAA